MNELLLMSIKTKYANQIFDGTKKFEFRRKSIGEKNCNKKIYVYSSELDKSIVGYIVIDEILCGNIADILRITNHINSQDIIDYYAGCDKCYALHIKETKKFLKPIKLESIKEKYKTFAIPQFYRYINVKEPIYEELESRNMQG